MTTQPPTPGISRSEDIACRTKHRYPSKASAKRTLKRLRRQGRRQLAIYQCWYCEQFHLGHPPGMQTYMRAGRPSIGQSDQGGAV